VLRLGYAAVGLFALALGVVGVFLPLLPTVPFVLLAAFCFARSNPQWERRLLEHRLFGPHIHAWRRSGAISRKGKAAAAIAFAASAAIGLLFLKLPWALLPALAALIGGSWVLTRPNS
jgi:uncharacterized membrane protein YbaN (DUF454 family)